MQAKGTSSSFFPFCHFSPPPPFFAPRHAGCYGWYAASETAQKNLHWVTIKLFLRVQNIFTTAQLQLHINKQQLLNVHHAILYISLPSLHHYDMKLPNFTSPRYVVGEHNTKVFAFFLKYHKGLTSLTHAFHPRVYSLRVSLLRVYLSETFLVCTI